MTLIIPSSIETAEKIRGEANKTTLKKYRMQFLKPLYSLDPVRNRPGCINSAPCTLWRFIWMNIWALRTSWMHLLVQARIHIYSQAHWLLHVTCYWWLLQLGHIYWGQFVPSVSLWSSILFHKAAKQMLLGSQESGHEGNSPLLCFLAIGSQRNTTSKEHSKQGQAALSKHGIKPRDLWVFSPGVHLNTGIIVVTKARCLPPLFAKQWPEHMGSVSLWRQKTNKWNNQW